MYSRCCSAHQFKPMCGSRNFRESGGGGGGGSRSIRQKKSLTTFFCVFLALSLLYRSQMVNSKENYHSLGSRGGPTFSSGGGGSNCLIPVETHITCKFPGGSGPPVPSSGSALKATTQKGILQYAQQISEHKDHRHETKHNKSKRTSYLLQRK